MSGVLFCPETDRACTDRPCVKNRSCWRVDDRKARAAAAIEAAKPINQPGVRDRVKELFRERFHAAHRRKPKPAEVSAFMASDERLEPYVLVAQQQLREEAELAREIDLGP